MDFLEISIFLSRARALLCIYLITDITISVDWVRRVAFQKSNKRTFSVFVQIFFISIKREQLYDKQN